MQSFKKYIDFDKFMNMDMKMKINDFYILFFVEFPLFLRIYKFGCNNTLQYNLNKNMIIPYIILYY